MVLINGRWIDPKRGFEDVKDKHDQCTPTLHNDMRPLPVLVRHSGSVHVYIYIYIPHIYSLIPLSIGAQLFYNLDMY